MLGTPLVSLDWATHPAAPLPFGERTGHILVEEVPYIERKKIRVFVLQIACYPTGTSRQEIVTTSPNNSKKRKEPDTTNIIDAEQSDSNNDMSFEDIKKELQETKHQLAQKEQELLDTKKELELALKATAASKEEEEDLSDDDDEDSVENEKDPWTNRFRELREYRIVHGDCNVSKEMNKKLAKWATNQRQFYAALKEGKSGTKISQERITKLEGIGFSWGRRYPAQPTWDEQLEELQKFQRAMGHCNIMVNPTSPSQLAKWVTTQRYEYKRFRKGRDSLLQLEQIQQLRDIGFKWKGPKLA
ncbi:helicase [Seminavis robusta]|uniref:Helicase n=1 Tax=Seminavis robusta TaxID=568900 RepID=A0A9N8DYP1_9STRA|nr:helicase [Seminavis robusta]|eukprot:Sro471_g149700.1 helicase (302) ;mRNA; f:26210-27421